LLEEDACTICDDVRNHRKSYKNLRHWLTESPQTDGGKGSTVTNPIVVPVAIALGDTRNDNGGWGDLLYAVEAAGKYVSLDLTDCTLSSITVNIPYLGGWGSGTGYYFCGSTFTTGKSYVVHITFPRTTTVRLVGGDGTGSYPNYVHLGFTNLRSVAGGVTSISSAFNGCTTLTQVSFPNATSLDAYAFQGCTGLTDVSFPAVTSIGGRAFQGCIGLTSVSFPQATTIGSGAFQGCTGLTEVSFPEATTIGSAANNLATGAFDGCTNLVKAYFPKVTTFTSTDNTSCHFNGCTSLTEVYFPKATSIPATTAALSMFNGCTVLKKVVLTSATTIGVYAFDGCTALEELYIPLVRTLSAVIPASNLNKVTIARNCTIATQTNARVTAFKTYYDGAAAGQPNKAAGTYNYVGSAWTGDF
jgi:hypothetical protein